MKSDTPETDAIAAMLDRGLKHEPIKAIAKLERERDAYLFTIDKAKEEWEKAQIKCAEWQHKAQELTQENKQLRHHSADTEARTRSV